MNIRTIVVLLLLIETCLSTTGDGGIFGNWTTDSFGLPSFSWTMNQRTDPRASWPNSEDIFPMYKKRTDHFQMFGNDRINAMGVDDGYVCVLFADRGPTWANRFDESQRNLGGGYSYLNINNETYCSAYKYAPPASLDSAQRQFGMGYYRSTMTLADQIEVEHLVFAPFGDEPLVIDRVTLTDVRSKDKLTPLQVVHYEYWDVNRHQLATEWVRTGLAAPPGDALRDELNQLFFLQTYIDQEHSAVVANMTAVLKNYPSREDISDIDYYPPEIFLASLDAEIDQQDVFADQTTFFGDGTPQNPNAVTKGLDGSLLQYTSAYLQPAMLSIRRKLQFDGNKKQNVLYYAYGYVPSGYDLGTILSKYRNNASNLFSDTMQQWKSTVMRVNLPDKFPNSTEFERETVWRSYQILAANTYREYFGQHVIAQGSAYLYLHGADGAPRDTALFTLGTTYLSPKVSKESLKLIMETADSTTGAMTYSFVGHGVSSTALGLHAYPSDLDIFLMLGINEYLSITGDWDFLGEEIDFHPKSSSSLPPGAKGKTVLDHIRAAFVHLTEKVGTGAHGLVKIGDGDWDDGIVYEDPSPLAIAFSIKNGESVPNSQMAIAVLNQTAAILKPFDQQLSTAMKDFVNALIKPVLSTYQNGWFGRGLLSNLLNTTQEEQVIDYIEAKLSSPIGPRLAAGDLVWPAISQLMTWVYARRNPSRAWENLLQHLYATHAITFPDVWLGIMSGPDGWIADTVGSYPGGTWASQVTPMTDFPVSNINPDAMFINGLIRTFGIEPHANGDGFIIDLNRIDNQTLPFDFSTPILQLHMDGQTLVGNYHAFNYGSLNITVVKPTGHCATPKRSQSDCQIVFPLSFNKGDDFPFKVSY